MPQQARPPTHARQPTMLLLLGSLLTILGCLQPWELSPHGGTSRRGVESSIGLLIWGLALLMIVVTVVQPRRQRALIITLSGSASWWVVLWPFQPHATITRGWWGTLVGSGICLLVALAPTAWWRP